MKIERGGIYTNSDNELIKVIKITDNQIRYQYTHKGAFGYSYVTMVCDRSMFLKHHKLAVEYKIMLDIKEWIDDV